MPKYIVSSDSPIQVRGFGSPGQGLPGEGRPTDPDWGIEEGAGGGSVGQLPVYPGRPGHGLPPQLPPEDEWPELPPWFKPHPGNPLPLPVRPSVEHPMVPVDPEVTDPPEIWPPVANEWPDLSGKTLALARIYVSRHVNYLRWIVIDHEELKNKVKKAIDAVKDKLPAGGIGGRPPARPPGT